MIRWTSDINPEIKAFDSKVVNSPWPFLGSIKALDSYDKKISLPLSYLTILFQIKLRGISRIITAEIINRCIRSKCKIYMGIVIRSTIVDCLENRTCYGTTDKYVN